MRSDFARRHWTSRNLRTLVPQCDLLRAYRNSLPVSSVRLSLRSRMGFVVQSDPQCPPFGPPLTAFGPDRALRPSPNWRQAASPCRYGCGRRRRSSVMQSGRRHRGPNPRNRGVDAKRTGRQPRIHANLLQGLPIAVLSVFKGLEQELPLVRTRASRGEEFREAGLILRAIAGGDGPRSLLLVTLSLWDGRKEQT